MRIHLVDGTYELFRHFYSPAPDHQAPDGREVGGVRGLLATLIKLLRDRATHVGCAFDHEITSFRNDLFDGYKTGEGIDPVLKAQFPLAEAAVQAFGLTCWPMIEFEADDALAAAAHQLSGHDGDVEQIVICSPDKDFAQCVESDRVVLLDRRRDRTVDEEAVWEKFGVAPESIPDFLALVGDKADGIPGLSGFGKKTAATLLAHYRHLDQIPEDGDDWEVKVRGASGLSERLREHREDALLYRRLATLREDSLDSFEVVTPDALEWHGAPARFREFCESIGCEDLLSRVTRWADGG